MSLADVALRQMPAAPMLILLPMLLPPAVALFLPARRKGRPLASGRRLAVICAAALLVALDALLPLLRPDLLPDEQPLTLPLLPDMALVWQRAHWMPLLVLSLLWVATALGCRRFASRLPEDALVRLEAGLALLVGAVACAVLAANALTRYLGVGLTALCLGGLAATRMRHCPGPAPLPAGGLRMLATLPAYLDKGLDRTFAATAHLTIRLGRGCLRLDSLPLWAQLALTFVCLASALLGLHLLLVGRGPVQ